MKLSSWLQHCLCQKQERLRLDWVMPGWDTSRSRLLY